MITTTQAFKRYGNPVKDEAKFMKLWDVPEQIEIGTLPNKVYCNKDLIVPLQRVFTAIVSSGRVDEIKTWDGCYNVRPVRGYEKAYNQLMAAGKIEEAMKLISMHAFGLAIDLNAAWNGLGKKPTLSKGLVQCFTDNGFDWGGNWARLDGMHFQLSSF